MIVVESPRKCEQEISYVCSVIFEELLATDYKLVFSDTQDFHIKHNLEEGSVVVKSSFFNKIKSDLLKNEYMPQLPLKEWNVDKEPFANYLLTKTLPVIFGEPGVTYNEQVTRVNIDIFGSVFFMLSRFEEFVTSESDEHGRFPANASLAMKAGFLERPIVDEYIEVLKYCIQERFPSVSFSKNKFEKIITCDVDWPFSPHLESLRAAVRKSAVSLIKQKDTRGAIKTLLRYLYAKSGREYIDEHREAISWLLNENEKNSNIVRLYFIPLKTHRLDNTECFSSERMKSLLRNIHDRGHEIGLHPGYQTFNNQELFSASAMNFYMVLDELNISQPVYGGRQHYLRWNAAHTPACWEEQGFGYDSSLAFAEVTGFRAGTCQEYTMYDLNHRRPFRLKQRPLITMEDTIISPRYEGLGLGEQSLDRFLKFKSICQKYEGKYTLLWHNCRLVDGRDREIYSELIK
ncbi:DUF7033 domain-containing protein [Vibrio galatheae]|uniref:DUF7033 domain-containing protein n=1 Tax=Vibrio galatheae TaxID=579748 RepID=UPI0006991E65|nr:hypothetical protein [Vibrio galatheae]